MTRIEKIVAAVNRKYPGLIDDKIKTALVEADDWYDFFTSNSSELSTEDMLPKLYVPPPAEVYHKPKRPSPNRLSEEEVAERQKLANRLKFYWTKSGLSIKALAKQLQDLGIEASTGTITGWLYKGMPGEKYLDKLKSFLEAAEIKN